MTKKPSTAAASAGRAPALPGAATSAADRRAETAVVDIRVLSREQRGGAPRWQRRPGRRITEETPACARLPGPVKAGPGRTPLAFERPVAWAVVDNRAEMRDFLASRRAKITPERAGLTLYGRNRRVPGLRREEVAQLAGLSVDYYTR